MSTMAITLFIMHEVTFFTTKNPMTIKASRAR